MIPYAQYLKWAQADEAGVLARFDRALTQMAAANAKVSEEEVEADLRVATKTVRTRKSRR